MNFRRNIPEHGAAFTHDDLVDGKFNILNLNDCISKTSWGYEVGT